MQRERERESGMGGRGEKEEGRKKGGQWKKIPLAERVHSKGLRSCEMHTRLDELPCIGNGG